MYVLSVMPQVIVGGVAYMLRSYFCKICRILLNINVVQKSFEEDTWYMY